MARFLNNPPHNLKNPATPLDTKYQARLAQRTYIFLEL
jgi:hypothetical protein